MKLAAIDLGSNTIKLTVAEADTAGRLTPIHHRAEITRIGEGLDADHILKPAAIERTVRALSGCVDDARQAGAVRIRCVATAGLRGASNADDFIEQVRSTTGIEVEIIDGLTEATLAYRAPASTFGPGPLIVVDVGGRSTEIITGIGAEIRQRVSLEIGGVRLTERFLPSDPPSAPERAALEAHVRETLSHAPPAPADATLVGVSGTVLSLMGVHLGLSDMSEAVARGEGGWLPFDAVTSAVEALAAVPTAARRRGTVIPEGRADVIVAGATVVREICAHYGVPAIRVTQRGVRFGVLAEMLDDATLKE